MLIVVLKTGHIMRRSKAFEDSAFMSEIGFDIAITGGEAFMTQPRFDERLVDARLTEMRGGGMPEVMSRDAFSGQARTTLGRTLNISLHDGPDTKACKGEAALIDEEVTRTDGLRCPTVTLVIKLKQPNGGGPQRHLPGFVSLPSDVHKAIGHIKPGETSIGNFRGSRSGVVDEIENGQVPDAIAGIYLRLSEDIFKLLTVQEVHHGLIRSF
ncbi:MAG: hypothetical protein KCHDKBKB_02392 [Elusimicrobia bacterium]|nr:hypothetical protein [Elusimicrobiota bacterium]